MNPGLYRATEALKKWPGVKTSEFDGNSDAEYAFDWTITIEFHCSPEGMNALTYLATTWVFGAPDEDTDGYLDIALMGTDLLTVDFIITSYGVDADEWAEKLDVQDIPAALEAIKREHDPSNPDTGSTSA